MNASKAAPWPTELRLMRAEKQLYVTYDDGRRFTLPAEYLRVERPIGRGAGPRPGQRVIIAGRAHVGIMDLETVRQLRGADQV